MRLLWFNLATNEDDPILGFATSWIRSVARRVRSVRVITMQSGRFSLPGNVLVYSVGKEQGYSEPRRAFRFYGSLASILRHERIDACFSHMMPIFTVLAAPLLRFRKIPIITWYAHREVPSVLKIAYFLSDRIVSISRSSYRYLDHKFTALGHGLDTERFRPNGAPPAIPPLILSVGRISPIKDLITLLEAVSWLRQSGRDVRCALVGEPPERDLSYARKVRERARELGLESVVEFAGAMPNPEAVPWYGRCLLHVNLCPSGALDKAPLEAMACGKPSLIANEGFRDVLRDWAPRLLFRHGDPRDLADKIAWLLDLDEETRQRIGQELRQRVLEAHSLERLADRLVEIFDEVRCR